MLTKVNIYFKAFVKKSCFCFSSNFDAFVVGIYKYFSASKAYVCMKLFVALQFNVLILFQGQVLVLVQVLPAILPLLGVVWC